MHVITFVSLDLLAESFEWDRLQAADGDFLERIFKFRLQGIFLSKNGASDIDIAVHDPADEQLEIEILTDEK